LKPYRDITDPRVAKALAHPLRTRILGALEGRTASPSQLAAELDAPLGVLSYHVRRLTALGFVKLVRRVPRRGAVEHYYTATSRPRINNEVWGTVPAVVKQATISAALDQIGAYVGAAAASGGFDDAHAHLTRSPVTVDGEGWRALSRELDAMTERIREIEAASGRRLRAGASASSDDGGRSEGGVQSDGAGQSDDGGRSDAGGRSDVAGRSDARDASVVLMLFESDKPSPAGVTVAASDGGHERSRPQARAQD
jgi:DNA-binding transcriptional ArsR family regulator